MKGKTAYRDDPEAGELEGEVDREMLVRAPEPRDRLPVLQRSGPERYLAPHDAHEVADNDLSAIAELGGEVLPVARHVHYMPHKSVSGTN